MCGRFANYNEADWLGFLINMNIVQRKPIAVDSYNVSPTAKVPVVFNFQKQNYYHPLTWGFQPRWKTDKTIKPIINARVETVWQKPSFSPFIQSQRCLVLCNNFYEWERQTDKKQAYAVTSQTSPFLLLAGIINTTVKEDWQCSILTRQANDDLSAIHNRMPIVVNENKAQQWLNNDSPESINSFFNEPNGGLKMTAVSDYVNNSRHDDIGCLESL